MREEHLFIFLCITNFCVSYDEGVAAREIVIKASFVLIASVSSIEDRPSGFLLLSLPPRSSGGFDMSVTFTIKKFQRISTYFKKCSELLQ